MRWFNWFLYGGAVLALAGGLWWQGERRPPARPEAPKHRVVAEQFLASPWERMSLPEARVFEFPLGARQGGLAYNAQPFLDWNGSRGGYHLGDDWNGIGGGNTDAGDPVRSIAAGRVLYTGTPSAGWGKVVVVGHRLATGELWTSFYAHLESVAVSVGSFLVRGQRLGSIGTADGLYLAHLHFELRRGAERLHGAGYASLPRDPYRRGLRSFLDEWRQERFAEFLPAPEPRGRPLPTTQFLVE
ncbi:MAG: M23 family metallopeptidase [Verrucomicrobiota bacterium]